MAQPPSRREEHPSTYFVQDRSNQKELARLQILDQMFTAGMGGILPEQANPTSFHRVLDVGCGTGGWLIQAAKTYPNMSVLLGVDISGKMLHYARSQAQDDQIGERIEFVVMDALGGLEFPDAFFDLVNHRSAVSWLRTWDWPKLLQEYQRVCKPGGVIRVTENDMPTRSSSPALMRLLDIALQAFYRAGHFFTPERKGATSGLAQLLEQQGVQNVQSYPHTIDYRAGTPEGERFCEGARLAYQTMIPFLHKWSSVPDDYEAIYQQMLREMQQPDFTATITLLTVWGTTAAHDPSNTFVRVQ